MQTIESSKDRFYISASAAMIDPRRLILKDNDLFGLFDRYGDIIPYGNNDTGLYFRGTRFLSAYQLRMEGRRLLFLTANVDEDNVVMSVDLTNPDMDLREGRLVKDTLHIMRSRVLLQNICFEELSVKNFGGKHVRFQIELSVDSDFRDIFEIRGLQRKARGEHLPPEERKDGLDLAYKGLDGVKRLVTITTDRHPDAVRENSLFYNLDLAPGEREDIYLQVACLNGAVSAASLGYSEAAAEKRRRTEALNKDATSVWSSNDRFNQSISRSLADINMMLTKNGCDCYPYGGIPWFCTPFGRDGLITALECLWIKPQVAKGVLKFLARTQAEDLDRSRVSDPGKILHEARQGEMATLNEVPFGLYYGSVDSTPLFLILAAAYWQRTGDDELIRELWPAIEKAIEWLEQYGDPDGDGFLEYIPHKAGLRNQGWKDSQDSVFHADGSLAPGSIALCEVQAYSYAAKKKIADICRFMGGQALCDKLLAEAAALKEKFNRDFWDDKLGTYVLALDGEKKPCRVATSNAGQCLFSGIAEPEKALKVALSVTSPRMFSGWGVRTMAEGEARYNPMSYHNGSVWPHDNAIIASGLSFCGLKEYFLKLFTAMFDASVYMEAHRLPELFCGFERRKRVAPTLYPVACAPQTWAAGALLLMLQASLGMSFEAERSMIIFRNPVLPDFLSGVRLTNLMVGRDKSADLNIKRYHEGVTIEILRKSKGVSILTYK